MSLSSSFPSSSSSYCYDDDYYYYYHHHHRQMSFDVADVENTRIDDLEEKQLKVLEDWEKKLGNKYPLVGTLVD